MHNFDISQFFSRMPEAFPIYEALAENIRDKLGQVDVIVGKSQIAFSNIHRFAFVWLPFRRIKGRPDFYIGVTFGLDRRVSDARIAGVTELYPNRWTHHVLVQSKDEIDEQLMSWIEDAYFFALQK